MGSFEYGIFVLVWTTMIIAGNLSCLGFHTSVIRFIPEYREKGMLAELRGILVTSRLFVLIASTASSPAIGAGHLAAVDRIEPYYVVPFILGTICLPMIALSDVLQGIARQCLGDLGAVADLHHPPGADPRRHGRRWRLRLPAECAETAVIAAILATYATTLAQLVRVTARVDRRCRGPGRAPTCRPPGSRCRCRSSWSRASSSC
jgi:hypothetical protein